MNRDFTNQEVAEAYRKLRPDYPDDIRNVVLDCLERNSIRTENKRFLLDVGCGGGTSTKLFTSDFEKILAIDISPAQIDIARKVVKNSRRVVEFQVVDDNLFPVEDDSVDVVICATALHYLNLPTFFTECERVLVNGGIVAVVFAFPHALRSLDGATIANLFDERCECRRALDKFLKSCGMKDQPRECCLGLYKPIYEQIKNRTKRWEAEITVELEWTVKKYFRMMETIAGYKKNQHQGVSNDPLKLFTAAISDEFHKRGLEFAMDARIIVSYYMPVIIIDKRNGHKIM